MISSRHDVVAPIGPEVRLDVSVAGAPPAVHASRRRRRSHVATRSNVVTWPYIVAIESDAYQREMAVESADQ
jgi:hypothetical protein